MNHSNSANMDEHYDAATAGYDSNQNTQNTPNTPQTLFNGAPLSQQNSMEAISLLAQQLEELRALNAQQSQEIAQQTQEIATMRATASNNHYSYAYLPPPHVPQDPGTAPARPGRMQLPSLPLYNGNTAEFQDWAMLVYAKLEGDGATIGDARKQIFHLLMALEGDARRYMVPWVGKNVINNPGSRATPTDFMKFLAEGFENTGAREEALMKLTSMKQGNRTFQSFLLEFNQTMYAAGQTEQEDAIKITYLKNALCRELLLA
jgi:hypothetical protein